MSRRACVILAAGQGTRMKSALPKVLHPVGGRAMLDRAIDAAQALGCEKIVVVVGAHSPEVGAHVEKRLGAGSTALQDPPLGTGHAVLAARAQLADFDGDVLITYADVPLLGASAIEPLFALRDEGADVGVLGFEAKEPGAYGRLMLNGRELLAIVEAKDASAAELQVHACNSGVMVARAGLLFDLLDQVGNDNAKGEYYLTDVAALARKDGRSTRVVFAAEDDVMGVNSQAELAQAEALFQQRARARLMADGVSMTAPETVFFSSDTEVEGGVRIEPNVVFGPKVRVERGALIRAFSHLEGCVVHAGAQVGPFARLRPGADIGAGAHIGNFVEVKNVKVGPGAKANHLTYLGDGEVGAKANIGAGTIFCNYDGFEKAKTVVGAGAFVGSNSSLVAPVTIGDGAYVGSGSVVTKDVAPDSLVLERSEQIEKPGWAARFRETKHAKKAKT
ncbi:MAG TPA: bifunctional UDP-N-acetylglucosamine diphosphorylase/glucosamine-1-phosphate N-acetyltransferase GlmU [Caulobacteraceae bacterium]|jgi:bifunctional UDP-N-acetylglucosamine pyrophosphorylase/glucosamine-1-phosphate N-acetyltransferase|nr:bifunctional UDP-N-acetylglucosamine diphosphorylase/glucosamine-1-phosphate N-acetyltransferase GlmU [Caulobacteraceae bacterium]